MIQAHPLSQKSPDAAAPDQERQPPRPDRINTSETERLLSIAGGALLAIAGLSRRSISGALVAAVGGGLIYRGVSGHCDVYQLLGVDRSRQGACPAEYFERGIHVEVAYTINKLPWDLYEYWRKFENLPRIMSHLESVRVIDDQRSRWVAKGPAGYTIEWDAQIINDEPQALIAWRSLPGADVDHAGSVRFVPAPDGRGTEVKVVLDYIPPAGRVGAAIAKLFGEDPEQQIREDLRNFKRTMETG